MNDATVKDIGEFSLIAALADVLPKSVRTSSNLRLGIGDDAAVWQPEPGESLLLTTDSLIEGVHYRLDWTGWHSLGMKSLAVNLSDIAAMGGQPRLALYSLALTGNEKVSDLLELYGGVGEMAARYGVVVAGGDIVRTPAAALHVTVIGETRDGRYLTRGGARAGDLIAVSGTLGAAAAGVQLLGSPPDDPRRLAATADALINSQLCPEPRVALGELLLSAGASSAMDLSDGLFGDLPKILAASGVSARIEADQIPVAASVRALFPETWFDLATRGGEDYELLFTASPGAFNQIREAATAIGSTVTAIGEIVAMESGTPIMTLIEADGAEHEVAPGAWDHFGNER